ncbi:MAG: hypothetical protein ABR928_02490 [Terracidiphilus sp.]|jgi:hypothetical protein
MKYIALIVAILSGWVISQFLLDGAIGAYVSVLFAYHFFLAFLLGYMDWSGGLKIPVQRAATVHAGILAFLLVFIAGRAYIPAFGLVAAFAPLIGFLEVEWIFGKQRKQHEVETVPGLPYSASQSDYSDFLNYLKQPSRQFAKAGRPVQEEYAFWLAERNKKRPANQGRGNTAAGEAQAP